MEVKLPTEGTRYVQALLLTATAYLQCRAHFLPAVAAYRGYGRPAVPKVPVQALRACLAIGHGTLPLPSVAWVTYDRYMTVTTEVTPLQVLHPPPGLRSGQPDLGGGTCTPLQV